MLIPNHPEDERLAALAGDDAEAGADAALTSHVADCARCADLVAELGGLRASLADLPDLAPSSPLRLLPPADDAHRARADRLGGWVRRVFAPVLTAGAALALVGVVGTAAPAMQGGGTESAEPDEAAAEFDAAASPAAGEGGAADAERDQRLTAESAPPSEGSDTFVTREQPTAEEDGDGSLPAERSPWPMVLFTGVALVIGALLLRWILVPRAG